MVTSCRQITVGGESILRVKLVGVQDVVTTAKTPAAQHDMFVCAERVYGIAILSV